MPPKGLIVHFRPQFLDPERVTTREHRLDQIFHHARTWPKSSEERSKSGNSNPIATAGGSAHHGMKQLKPQYDYPAPCCLKPVAARAVRGNLKALSALFRAFLTSIIQMPAIGQGSSLEM
jgi:hypothetical protein